MIKYRPSPAKILEGVVWLANRLPGIDQYQIVKMFFFADKKHLNTYGRPIFGDKYVALEHGPIASLTLNAIKRLDRFVEPSYIEQFEEALDFSQENNIVHLKAKRDPNLDEFSDTDIEMLLESFEENKDKDFAQLRSKTHKEPAWIDAWANRGVEKASDMDFRLFIDESDELEETLEFMENTCGCVLL